MIEISSDYRSPDLLVTISSSLSVFIALDQRVAGGGEMTEAGLSHTIPATTKLAE